QPSYSQFNGPCDAVRWENGGSWNNDGTVDDKPAQSEPIKGVIKCGASAETQSQVIPSNSIYNPGSFTIEVGSCIDPSTHNVVYPENPVAGQPVIWLNFDVRPNAGSFEIQINENTAGNNIAWALYV